MGAPCATFSIGCPVSSSRRASTTRALMSGTAAAPRPGPSAPPSREVQPVVAHGHLLGLADVGQLGVVNQHRPVAERLDGAHVVAHEHDRLAGVALLVEHVHALLGERHVAHREHLVHKHDVGVGLHHHGKSEAHEHAGRVVLQLQLGEVLELGEVEDGVEPAARLSLGEAHQHPVDHHVLARGQVLVKAHAQFDEGRQAPRHPDPAGVGAVDARQDLEQGALAGAVLARDSEELALVDVEGHVAQRMELAVLHAPKGMGRPLL